MFEANQFILFKNASTSFIFNKTILQTLLDMVMYC